MHILAILLIVVLAAAAVVLLRKARAGAAWARPASGVCAAAVVILAAGALVARRGGGGTGAAREGFERHMEVCGAYLGEVLGAQYEGARVIILTPPAMVMVSETAAAGNRLLVENLQRGLEGRTASVEVRDYPVPEYVARLYRRLLEGGAEEAEARDQIAKLLAMEESPLFSDREMVRALAEIGDEADVVISTVGLALGTDVPAPPRGGAGPRLVLLNALMEDARSVLAQPGVDAVVGYRNDPEAWRPGMPIPRDVEEAFQQRFLLVTR